MNEEKDSSTLLSRRTFVGSVAAAAGFMIVPRRVLGGPGYQAPSDRVQVATVGYINGMGTSNTNAVGKVADVVALCDCDESAAALKNAARTKIFETFPNAVRYKDYRVMLEKQKDIDGVIVATPDHAHAVIAMAAMQLGKHVYVQKPLTRTVSEARALTEAARKYKVDLADGQPGPVGRGRAPDRGVAGRRGHRRGDRGPLLDEPADLAAGHAAPDRHAAGAGRSRLGHVDRPVADAAVPHGVSPVQLARLVGLRRGRPGRHGVPRDGRVLLDAPARLPDQRDHVPGVQRGGRAARRRRHPQPAHPVQRQLPAGVARPLHVPGPRWQEELPAREAALVRRRVAAGAA